MTDGSKLLRWLPASPYWMDLKSGTSSFFLLACQHIHIIQASHLASMESEEAWLILGEEAWLRLRQL